jgi:hypothetical protein
LSRCARVAEASAEKGIEAIKTHAPSVTVVDETVEQSASGQLVALIEQFVDVTTRRLATVLADRPAHRGEQP